MSTDAEWEKWGATNPYFGVLSQKKFRKEHLNEAALNEFFASGEQDVATFFDSISKYIDPNFSPKTALDFGCGTGRLLIATAARVNHMVGLDVSDSMLIEAQKNCVSRDIKNVTFLKSDDALSLLQEQFDLIYSHIVLQHIPVERGENIFTRLVSHINHGGVGVIQVVYGHETLGTNTNVVKKPYWARLKNLIKWCLRFSQIIENQDPVMEMNFYDLNRLLFTLQRLGVHRVYSSFTNHGGYLGVFLYFQKP